MFSEAFAERVIADARLAPGSVVLDPWLGVGTTASVAAASGYRAVGVDINPVMIALSRGRCLPAESAAAAIAAAYRLEPKLRLPEVAPGDPLLNWFKPQTASVFRSFADRVRGAFPGGDPCPEACFLFTAIFEAAREFAATHRSKNPTWVKRPRPNDRTAADPGRVVDRILAISQEKRELCPAKVPQHSPRLQVGTSTCLGLPDESVDFVLTSPPYCTRIDYAISTSVELAILGGGDDDLAALRDRSMGTSTIRKRPVDPVPEWGPLCLALIDEISSHPSKSSHSYYRKTYLQYFEDLYRSLGEIERCTRPGAVVAMVVQDSFYKGVHVDLPGIITEMGRSLEWRVVRRAEYPVSRNMRRVNTRSRAYRADVASTETVLWLKTSG